MNHNALYELKKQIAENTWTGSGEKRIIIRLQTSRIPPSLCIHLPFTLFLKARRAPHNLPPVSGELLRCAATADCLALWDCPRHPVLTGQNTCTGGIVALSKTDVTSPTTTKLTISVGVENSSSSWTSVTDMARSQDWSGRRSWYRLGGH